MQNGVIVLSNCICKDSVEDLDGLVISLIPPFNERQKIIMIEEYSFGENCGILASFIIDGDLLQDISDSEIELRKNLIEQVRECLEMHSYEFDQILEILLDDNLECWIEETFDKDLQDWKNFLKYNKDSRL